MLPEKLEVQKRSVSINGSEGISIKFSSRLNLYKINVKMYFYCCFNILTIFLFNIIVRFVCELVSWMHNFF